MEAVICQFVAQEKLPSSENAARNRDWWLDDSTEHMPSAGKVEVTAPSVE